MKYMHRLRTVGMLLFCLLALTMLPGKAHAYENMTTGDDAIELIKRYESFSPAMYYENGHWYVGYGSQVPEGSWPNGVTEEDAVALLRDELQSIEGELNAFFAKNNLCPTQSQFDALVDFTYTLGSSWLSGDSLLVQIVRGETVADRRETARAFGVWSHAGGSVLPGLAVRRLEEAALYLDGSTAYKDEFVYLAIQREDDVTLVTDFAVYERGGVYDAFPMMYRLGYTLTALRTADGATVNLGDPVTDNRHVSMVWEKNVYTTGGYSDVPESKWFYDYVMELSEAGVVGGRGDGTFDPQSSVTVGEALKLILLAARCEEQSAVEGAHWASGYASLALQYGYLSDSLLADLDAPIARRDVAQLAAKAIGFSQSSERSPFADTNDGYVTALYTIGVLTGSEEDGQTVFHPNQSITRAEVSTIVWRLQHAVALGQAQSIRHPTRYYGTFTPKILGSVPRFSYQRDRFTGSGKTMWYEEPGVTVMRGVDVARFQGSVDWNAVKADGIDFALMRVGGRYWGSGEIYDDSKFEEYYAGASAAGLRLGVYFFSQAVSVEEAIEEADYVLSKLAGKQIDGPIVFDWETAGASDARTNGLPVSTVCDCAIAYCERVKAFGYNAMVYMNTYDGYRKYDLTRLAAYDIWYAGEYEEDVPRFFYDFDVWQYTDKGSVNGIDGKVDMDLWFFR